MSDLDVLKEIPGYKAILKSVLKSQIQLLMEQLSEHAGEESIILTASVNDGSLSHLGSSTGKGFFEGRDEIKSQFLGYCLKTYHKQKTREPPKPYQRKHPSPRTSPSTQPAKRPCVYPVSLSQYSSETYPSSNIETHRLPERRTSQEQTDSTMDLAVGTSGDSSSDTIVKTELNDQNTSNSGPTAVTSAAEFLPSSIHLSHTQGSSETNEGADNENTKNDSSDETRIKVEQLEDELEITGVEMAAGSINHWGQGQPGYIPESDSSYSMPSDQSGYNHTKLNEDEKVTAIKASNKAVGEELLCEDNDSISKQPTPSNSLKRKRSGNYGTYSPKVRLQIAKYCIDNGPAKTARHFTGKLGQPISESTIRSIKKTYLSNPKKELFKTEMPRSPRGRQTLLPTDIDELVQEYVRSVRVTGGVVNTDILIAGATGIIEHKNSALLKVNGGPVELTKDWAKSLMSRMGLSKCKCTKGIKSLASDFDVIKKEFNSRVKSIVETHDIPDSLIFNWDQIAVNLVPCGNWTMEKKGSKQVSIQGIDDKRQITLLLAISKAGSVLPPQVIYSGLTDNCHPKYQFPESWDIFHTPSHWSTEKSMLRYVDKVIIPYFDHIRKEEDLPLRQKALCIFDVDNAHRGKPLLNLLEKSAIKVAYVPGTCTDQLQPLDLIPNNIFKQYLKSEFHTYYSGEIQKQMKAGVELSNINIDLHSSVIKPLHAQWLVNAVERLAKKPDILVESFDKAGL